MTLLQAIRRTRFIVRWVLAWFFVSMAVAVAAPVVQPQASVLVCSAAGSLQLVDTGNNNGLVVAGHTLDCVLCLAWCAAPPAAVNWAGFDPSPASHAAYRGLTPVVLRSDATLTARAPPAQI